MRYVVLAASLLALTIGSVPAQQLGQSKDAIVAHFGRPAEESPTKRRAIYRTGAWQSEIVYVEGIAKLVTVSKGGALTDNEIAALLARNADGALWHELEIGGATRVWQRTDLALARCDRAEPRAVEMTDSPLRRILPGRDADGGKGIAAGVLPSKPVSLASIAVAITPEKVRSGFLTLSLGAALLVILAVIARAVSSAFVKPLLRRPMSKAGKDKVAAMYRGRVIQRGTLLTG